MGHRLSKIYTRTGHDGTTGLGNGDRVPKDDARVEAYGAVDELNSTLGLVLAEDIRPEIRQCLDDVQHHLFDLGAELCIPGHEVLTQDLVDGLEATLDKLNEDLPMLKEFILPRGGRAASACHLARAVCRRAERRIWTLAHQEDINRLGPTYLNRLSDLLFVMARVISRDDENEENLWQGTSQD